MKLGTLALAVGALMATLTAEAFAQAKIDPNTWVYGPRNNATTPTIEIWNPAMKKLKEGGQLFGGTIRAPDPDKARVNTAITEISTKHPQLASRIKEITDAR